MDRLEDIVSHVDDALTRGDGPAAFAVLRPWLSHPTRLRPEEWDGAMELFARVARVVAGDSLADQALACRSGDDIEVLYDLGYELIEQELCDVAATVLARAVELRRDLPGLLSELIAALERDGQHLEACRWLRRAPALVDRDYTLRYLLAWNTALSGDLDALRAQLPSLASPSTSAETMMRERLVALLARAEGLKGASPLDGDDLRGWHYAMHGSVLLRLSPHGFREGMRGRYAFTQDSELRCREAIERVRLCLDALRLDAPRVFALPDRDSLILAIATSRVLDVPMEEWDSERTDDPGVVVAYDLSAAPPDLLTQLQPHRVGQVLWEHASRWVSDRPVAADLVSYLYQFNVTPWGERVVVDQESDSRTHVPADPARPEEIGARIAALDVSPRDLFDRDELVRFVRACAPITREGECLTGALRDLGLRPRQWTGGPVQSSRFR